MKKLLNSVALGLFLVLSCACVSQGTIVSGTDQWGISLDPNESFTCIAHYVWDSVEFTLPPEQTSTYTAGGNWADIGWHAALSEDKKTAYIYGPRLTNNSSVTLNWFSYNLLYQWDDEDADFDPQFPVYIDTVIFDGDTRIDYWGWRGIPGVPESWRYRTEPYHKDEPEHEDEEFYENPVPEPMTVSLLVIGTFLLRKRR